MCTAITFTTKDHYFGRNLDLDHCYREAVTVMPRNYPLKFRHAPELTKHYAMIGIATVDQNYPLYYDATNEHGLSMAGLNFPEHAVYQPLNEGAVNIAPFEFISWVLSQCKDVSEALARIRSANIANITYSDAFPLTPLHWILADKQRSVVLEPMQDGLHLYDNSTGVLTNSPPFHFHAENLRQYLNLTRDQPENRFSKHLKLTPFSFGVGAFGLPGDLSSASRFIRAAFTKLNCVCQSDESASVNQFFHILDSVAQTKGCARVGDGWEFTVYSSCCNTEKGLFYYKTYENSQITCIKLHNCDLQSSRLSTYPLRRAANILTEN